MRTIYLYHKISPLGLNYLGITVKDPFKYRGSGIYWKRHLQNHKFKLSEIKTIILFKSYDKEEIRIKGLYYSKLYNIIVSEKWANLKNESGYVLPEEIACLKNKNVIRFNKNTKQSKQFLSINDAAKSVSVDPSSISYALKKGTRCKRFYWYYLDDYKEHLMKQIDGGI